MNRKRAFLYARLHKHFTPPAVPVVFPHAPPNAHRESATVADRLKTQKKIDIKNNTRKSVKSLKKHLTRYTKSCII